MSIFNQFGTWNFSCLSVGKCPPGWTLNTDRCYRYMGAALPYAQAGQFCRVSQISTPTSSNVTPI